MIERTTRGDITILRMAHGKASALDLEFLRALIATFGEEERRDSGAVVLTGTGSIFSAGVDLFRIVDGGKKYVADFLAALDEAFLSVFEFEKPLVAAINGHAIAGGAILAFACDRRVLARGKATIGVPELKVGVPFPEVPLEIVRHVLAPPTFQEAVYTGRIYGVDDALAHGLADELCEGEALLERACTIAAELARIPSVSYGLTKRYAQAHTLAVLENHAARSRAQMVEAWTSPEVQGAVRAYVERTIKK